LSLLDTYPSLDQCLSRSVAKQTNFTELFDASGALWPSNLRCKVDALFFNAPPADLCHAIKDHVLGCTVSGNRDAVRGLHWQESPAGNASRCRVLGHGAGIWRPNGRCGTLRAMTPPTVTGIANASSCSNHMSPRGISVKPILSDIPSSARLSYKPAAWERLNDLRKKYDPEGLFFGFGGGLSA
jgi:hypothetical protein